MLWDDDLRGSDWNVPDGYSYEAWNNDEDYDPDPIIWKDDESGEWYIDNRLIPPDEYEDYGICLDE